MFEHHYHNMLIKKYKFSDIHELLIKNNFKQIFKNKMPFRKHLNIFMKENKTKVSILVVNYNNAIYLDECLESMFNQSYEYKEIIFLDDGSKDNSKEILKKYENNIKIVKKLSKKNILPMISLKVI